MKSTEITVYRVINSDLVRGVGMISG